MGFRHPERLVWDFWTIEHDGLTWLFTLSASRDGDPDQRHWRSRIDLLTSRDLREWRWRGIALAPGPEGDWDDLALWTGSVARDPAGGFVMLYTGLSRREEGRVQRIGLARSPDLIHWTKHPAPVIEADPALYRMQGRRGSTNWRDPWLVRDPEAGRWRAWITAQHPDGPVDDAGAVALADSADLERWTVRPPVTAERLTEHLEVPQIIDGGRHLLVSAYAHHVPADGPVPQACVNLLYRQGSDRFSFVRTLEAWPTDSRYMPRRVRPGVGLCWRGWQPAGGFFGEISDPFPFDPVGQDG